MQRAEIVAVLGQAQRAGADAARRLDRRHDVQQRQLRRVSAQHKSAIEPALRRDQSRAAQHLEHLRQVAGGDVRVVGDLLSGQCRRPGLGAVRRQAEDRAKRVFSGLGDHGSRPFVAARIKSNIWTLISRIYVLFFCRQHVVWFFSGQRRSHSRGPADEPAASFGGFSVQRVMAQPGRRFCGAFAILRIWMDAPRSTSH